MCDTLVVVEGGAVWLAKNSDREPCEAQAVEQRLRQRHPSGARLRATHIEIDQVGETNEVVLARPAWMWGAEMGVNEHGLAIGNEAVFTRVTVDDSGLLGMDLVRLALERCKTADEALDLVTWMIARHGQGGRAGFRDRAFRYHNAFLIADPLGAWLLETAGRFWAALRVVGARTTSNVLTIGEDYTRLGAGTIEGARSLGLLRRGESFDFRRCFGRPVMRWLSGGDERRACTSAGIARAREESDGAGRRNGEGSGKSELEMSSLAGILRSHAGKAPHEGGRIVMPCAHASWIPTRAHGQTTGSMIARLGKRGSRQWFTGTSAPCLSVMKEVPLGKGLVDTGPAPNVERYDGASSWWLGERLHRAVLQDYRARRATFDEERAAMEASVDGELDARAASELWREHRERVVAWTERVKRAGTPRREAFGAWWKMQSARDGIPA